MSDMRRLAEIPFHNDADWMREKLHQSGARTAQDVIDFGCTGMMFSLLAAFTKFAAIGIEDVQARESILKDVVRIRSNMGGAGFGLPCYVPSTHFCLVHNTIGGLQQGQEQRYPNGLRYCTRPLTDAEELQVRGMQTFIAQEGLKEAQEQFGIEPTEEEPQAEPVVQADTHASPQLHYLGAAFTCPEHKDIVFACRYCLASAVIHGPFQPVVEIAVQQAGENGISRVPLAKLDDALANGDVEIVEAFVRVKRWSRKLIVEA